MTLVPAWPFRLCLGAICVDIHCEEYAKFGLSSVWILKPSSANTSNPAPIIHVPRSSAQAWRHVTSHHLDHRDSAIEREAGPETPKVELASVISSSNIDRGLSSPTSMARKSRPISSCTVLACASPIESVVNIQHPPIQSVPQTEVPHKPPPSPLLSPRAKLSSPPVRQQQDRCRSSPRNAFRSSKCFVLVDTCRDR